MNDAQPPKDTLPVQNDTVDLSQTDTTTPPPTQPPVSPAPSSHKSSRLPWVILIIVVLALGSAVTWLFLQNQSTASSLESTKQDLQSAKASLTLKDTMPITDNSGDGDTSVSTTTSDDELLINTTIAWIQARKGGEAAKVTISVAEKELPFARVLVSAEESGYMCVLKKSNDIWLVVFCGQSPPLQDELDLWGVPDSILKS